MNTYTGLQSIQLQNYRCFSDLTVELDKYMTVLVANNGAGKTTVLDAIAVSLSAFVGAFHNGKRYGISKDDVLLKIMDTEILEMEAQYPSILTCNGLILGEAADWERRMNTPHSYNTFKEAKQVIEIGERLQTSIATEENGDVVLPVIAYYGTGRLWAQKKITVNKVFSSEFYSRTSGYLDCLDPASSYKYFVDWLRYTSKAHNQLRDQNIEKFGEQALQMETPYQALLKGVGSSVDVCLAETGWHNLRFSSIHGQPIIEHPKYGVLAVNQLSDGIRNMIAMIADIAYRAVRLNKQFKEKAPLQSPGIVLIDEVDMHLHPSWQQNVLAHLRKAFPHMQFVVTTHSPQVLSTIPSENIRLLTENIDGKTIAAKPIAESYARTNADVLETVMKVSPMPKVKESADLERYRQIIEQGVWNSPKAQQLRQKLEDALGKNHAELIRLDTVKRRRELLG